MSSTSNLFYAWAGAPRCEGFGGKNCSINREVTLASPKITCSDQVFACAPLRRQYANVLNPLHNTFCLEETNVDDRPGSVCISTLPAAPKNRP